MLRKVEHVVIASPASQENSIPFFCPICEFVMRFKEDRTNYMTKGCCEKCALRFADPRLDEWRAGWRPAPEEIEEEKANRRQIPMQLDLSILF